MSRLLVILLLILGFVVGARTILLLGARKFRGTLLGQVFQSLREANDGGAGPARPGSGGVKGGGSPLMKCARCGEHVPSGSSTDIAGFVCGRCRADA